MKRHIWFAMLLLALSLGAAACRPAFKVTIPKRGQPTIYPQAQFPIEERLAKSKESHCWFQNVPGSGGWRLDADCERERLQFLIIHHTATDSAEMPATKADRPKFERYISDLEKKRLYEPLFQNQNYATPYFFGLPVHSGHEIEGVGESFTAYHHYVYPDGSFTTNLIPYRKVGKEYFVDMIAWHAGRWKPHNTGGVAVALMGNYEKSPPTAPMLRTLTKLVEYYRKRVPDIDIRGHKEVRPRPTACPGEWWGEWVRKLDLTHPRRRKE